MCHALQDRCVLNRHRGQTTQASLEGPTMTNSFAKGTASHASARHYIINTQIMTLACGQDQHCMRMHAVSPVVTLHVVSLPQPCMQCHQWDRTSGTVPICRLQVVTHHSHTSDVLTYINNPYTVQQEVSNNYSQTITVQPAQEMTCTIAVVGAAGCRAKKTARFIVATSQT